MKNIILFLIVLSFGFASTAQDTETANSLLWKITAPEGETSYLFGTYHLAGSEILNEKTRVKKIFEASENLVVETVIDSSRIFILATKYMMMPEISLEKLLDSNEYTLLGEKMKEVGIMDLSHYSNLKPMVLAGIYTVSLAQKITPDELNYGGQPLDIFLATMAAKSKKDVIALETMEEQLKLLYTTETVEEQAKNLMEIIQSENETEEISLKIIEAYYREDLHAMLQYADKMEASYGDFDHLLKDRNLKWVESLKPVLNKGGSFIAVGALHLPGENGLIQLLEKENYTVSPVMPVSKN